MRRRKKETNWQAIIVIFIAFIMIFSVVGYMFSGSSGEEKLTYNEHSLTKKGDKWSIIVDKKQALFDFFPSEVEDINISSGIIDRIKNTLEVDTTYYINNSYAQGISYSQYELGNVLNKHFRIYVRNGFTTNNSYALPIITCNDSTNILPVLYFKESNTTKIYLDNNCIIAEGKSELDFIKIKDRLLYGMFGIIG